MKKTAVSTLAMALLFSLVFLAQAKDLPLSPEKFYNGKTIKFIVGYAAGGGFDASARLLAPYLGKYTKAKVIIKNMPGSSGGTAVNHLYLAAKPDGLTIAIVHGRMAFAQLMGEEYVKYDFRKFNLLGRVGTERGVILVSGKSAYAKMSPAEVIGALKTRNFKFGSLSKDDITTINFTLISHALGFKPKLVTGYNSTADANMAAVRNEVDVVVNSDSTASRNADSKDLIPKFVISTERAELLPNVPAVTELTEFSPEGKWCLDNAVGMYRPMRIVIAPPAVPRERIAYLVEAIKKSAHDEKLLAQSQKMGMRVSYGSPKECSEDTMQMLTLKEAEVKKLKYIILEEFN